MSVTSSSRPPTVRVAGGILARLERCGWLESRWEDIEPAEEGRPRRRYRLSPYETAPLTVLSPAIWTFPELLDCKVGCDHGAALHLQGGA